MADITPAKNYKFITKCFKESKEQLLDIEAKQAKGLSYKEVEKLNQTRLKGCGLEGASRCFTKDTLVMTDKGLKAINEIKEGEKVLSYDFTTNNKEFRKVTESHHFKSNTKKLIKINFKNGKSITATEDHELYYKGAWLSIKDLVKLWAKL